LPFGRKVIAIEVHHLYRAHLEYLNNIFKGFKNFAFTLDAWTSPNTMAFLAITAHVISSWKMIDIVVAMPVFHGQSIDISFVQS
jgi:hypothetical protein